MSTKQKTFSVVREFKASKQKVFNAFAKEEAFAQWWGPVGMDLTLISFDFKSGGKTHYKMQNNSITMWGLFVYKNIVNPDLIEYVSSFSNESGSVAKAPFDMDYPLEVFNKLSFTEVNGVTTIRLEAHPINANEAQEATFHSISDNMQQGYNGTMDQLEKYLAEA